MDEQSIYRKLLLHGLEKFVSDSYTACRNIYYSPNFDIRVTLMFGMIGMALNIWLTVHSFIVTRCGREKGSVRSSEKPHVAMSATTAGSSPAPTHKRSMSVC